MTFREFMADLPNNATPEFAQREYDRYMAEFHGGEIKADFERKKHDPEVRKRYHPAEIKKSLEEKLSAGKKAAEFVDRAGGVPEKLYVPVGPYYYAEKMEKEGEEKGWEAVGGAGQAGDFRRAFPVTDDRRAQYLDYKVAIKLAKKLDSECGIEENALLGQLGVDIEGEDMAVGNANAGDEEDMDADADAAHDEDAAGDGEKKEGDEDKGKTGVDDMETDQNDAVAKPMDDAAAAARYEVKDESFESGQLDSVLQYLWIVHGIDYYGCKEYGFEGDYARRNNHKRVIRPSQMDALRDKEQHPNVGEQAPGAEGQEPAAESEQPPPASESHGEKPGPPPPKMSSLHDLTTHESKICERWLKRVAKGPPSAHFVKEDRIEEELEKFIEGQVVKHSDQKWGNKLSSKLFVAKNFVIKHIRNKHAHVLDAERERIMDLIYRENYVASKEKEQKRAVSAGRGGRGGRFGGRGGRGLGGRGGGHQGGQIMYADLSGRGEMMPVMMIPMGGGRGRGGRGGFGGRGGRGVGAGQYFDIDAPQHNRQCLDYGDL
jgi:hypothetical protein